MLDGKTMALGGLLADGMAGVAAVNQCGSSDQFPSLWLLAIGLLPSACLIADLVVTRLHRWSDDLPRAFGGTNLAARVEHGDLADFAG